MWPYCPCFENVLCGCIVWWNYCVVVATLALSTPAAQRDRARGSGLGSSYGTLIIKIPNRRTRQRSQWSVSICVKDGTWSSHVIRINCYTH